MGALRKGTFFVTLRWFHFGGAFCGIAFLPLLVLKLLFLWESQTELPAIAKESRTIARKCFQGPGELAPQEVSQPFSLPKLHATKRKEKDIQEARLRSYTPFAITYLK